MSGPDRDGEPTLAAREPSRDPASRHDGKSPAEIESDIARTRANLSETLDALERKFAPRHLMEKGVDMLRGSVRGNLDTRRVREALRANPIPLALIGVGLGWLLLHNVPATRGTAHRYARRAREGVAEAAGTVTERVKDWTGRTREAAESYGTGSEAYARTKSPGAAGRLQTGNERHMAGAAGASDVRSGATGYVADTATRAGEAAREAARRAAEASRAAARRAGDIAGQAGDYADRAKDRFAQVMDDYPLAVGALGFLAGTVIGAALPATRLEDEWLGEARDDAWREAQALGREAWERTQQVAATAVDAAREAAKDVVREAGEAAKDAAGDFAERVRGEAERQASATGAASGSDERATGEAAAGGSGTVENASPGKPSGPS